MEHLPRTLLNNLKRYGFTERKRVITSKRWYWISIDKITESNKLHKHYIDLCETDVGKGKQLVLAYHIETDKFFFRRTGGNNPTECLESIMKDKEYIPCDNNLLSFIQAFQFIMND